MTTTSRLTILTNSFHNTEYRTRKSEDEIQFIRESAPWQRTEAQNAFVRRARLALCGSRECTCGNELGER